MKTKLAVTSITRLIKIACNSGRTFPAIPIRQPQWVRDR
jgi:hypothetical protein